MKVGLNRDKMIIEAKEVPSDREDIFDDFEKTGDGYRRTYTKRAMYDRDLQWVLSECRTANRGKMVPYETSNHEIAKDLIKQIRESDSDTGLITLVSVSGLFFTDEGMMLDKNVIISFLEDVLDCYNFPFKGKKRLAGKGVDSYDID